MLSYCKKSELSLFEKIQIVGKKLDCQVYAVGGFVRDKFLRRESKDIDIVCVGKEIELVAHELAFLMPNIPEVHIFKTFGTAQLKTKNIEIELVTARKESYTKDSRNPIVEPATLQEDLSRRDFTINSLAISLNKDDFGKIIDPFNGIDDLQKKIIRTPLSPNTTFMDDPLRMLRAIRFATQLHFHIEETTWEGICNQASRLQIIACERINEEMHKILSSNTPSIGLELLFRSSLFQYFLPEIIHLEGVEQREGKGHKDNFYHTLQVVDNISKRSNNLWLRWVGFLHDIAKPITKKFEPGQGWTFHGHDAVGGKMVMKIFKRLKLPQNEKMLYVKKLVELHLRPISLTKEEVTDSAMRRLLFDAGNDLEDLMILCESDITSKNPYKVQKYLSNFQYVKQRLAEVEEKDKIRNWQPPIDGKIIMTTFNISPSLKVGIIKDAIREAILDNIIPNTYESAFQFMLKIGKDQGLEIQENKI
ncbi:MAG: CCA tRNA nucleotidyltransferase [Chitinophagaceae bacterium]